VWNKLGGNLPTVAVHEFAQHPVNGEIVAATHGRSLWVLDISALRQVKAENLADAPALYEPSTVVRWRVEPSHGGTNRRFVGENPARGAQIFYSLPKNADKVELKIVDITGATLRELPTRKEAGLHVSPWDLRPEARRGGRQGGGEAARGEGANTRNREGQSARRGGEQPSQSGGAQAARPGQTESEQPASEGGARAGGRRAIAGGGRRFGGAATVGPGAYRVVLTVDGKEFSQKLQVERDPVVADALMAEDVPVLDDEEEEEQEQARGGALIEERDRDSDSDAASEKIRELD
jgi:hypothetical protein